MCPLHDPQCVWITLPGKARFATAKYEPRSRWRCRSDQPISDESSEKNGQTGQFIHSPRRQSQATRVGVLAVRNLRRNVYRYSHGRSVRARPVPESP